jgi:hypothetical protein
MFLVAVSAWLAFPLELPKEVSKICGLVYSLTRRVFKISLCQPNAPNMMAAFVHLKRVCAGEFLAPDEQAVIRTRSRGLFGRLLCRLNRPDGWLLRADV